MGTLRGVQKQLFEPTSSVLRSATEAKGVVYTRRWVVELLLDLAGYVPESNLVDSAAVEPAAGEGAFLLAMIERLLSSCRIQGRTLLECRNSLVAYELDKAVAKKLVAASTNILIKSGVEESLASSLAGSWIRTGDYLVDDCNTKADFVIGNPPYVRLEDIPEHVAVLYRNSYPTMRGRADLYIAFFEAALHQLKADGVCAFICADRWMRNQYGNDLRRLITSEYSVDFVVEMHKADPFHEEVDAYPAITVIRRKQQGSAVIATVNSEAGNSPSSLLAANLRGIKQHGPSEVKQGVKAALIGTWFKGSAPWPCNSPAQLALLQRLEKHFSALECKKKRTKVGIGVATGSDDVYITTDPGLVEPSRLIKLALAKDIATGTLRWSGHYLVDPWDRNGLVDLHKYPTLRAYFEGHADLIKKRNTAKGNPTGWYRTIDRVHHALAKRPKLYIADIKNHLTPVLDQGETYPHHNLYFIQSEEWDLEVLGGLLFSAVGQFFVESYGVRMRGGYFRFQAQYLRRIRLPDPEAISPLQSEDLRAAFRERDRSLATRTALSVYGIGEQEMAAALGY